jgi:RNA polymerase sigma-70 factor (ECF subfamily)
VENDEIEAHLSQMSTQWTDVFQAHSGRPAEASEAVSRLMYRYGGAVHRYLLRALRDPDVAAELNQEFALRFVRGDFRHCHPTRGRFRDYVKRAVQNLINDYYRRRRPSIPLEGDVAEPAAAGGGTAHFEHQFLESWKNDLLGRAWKALLELEQTEGQPYHTVLRMRVDQRELRSAQLAEQLSATLGRSITAGAFRQTVQRARHKYVNYLIKEVAASLEQPTPEEIEEELGDLELLEFCRPYLKREPFSEQ